MRVKLAAQVIVSSQRECVKWERTSVTLASLTNYLMYFSQMTDNHYLKVWKEVAGFGITMGFGV